MNLVLLLLTCPLARDLSEISPAPFSCFPAQPKSTYTLFKGTRARCPRRGFILLLSMLLLLVLLLLLLLLLLLWLPLFFFIYFLSFCATFATFYPYKMCLRETKQKEKQRVEPSATNAIFHNHDLTHVL